MGVRVIGGAKMLIHFQSKGHLAFFADHDLWGVVDDKASDRIQQHV